jgi:hydroxymethylglutaryl-CoA synthase
MSLFSESGNTDIEGATVVNACYGGTAALLNALAWVDSSAWDGRYAIVVAGDIAVYADGPARPTGGCGSVAMLIGRNAPLAIDLSTRTTHATHVWDFFKPNMDSEYPEVNGALSQTCYFRALDDCYTRFVQKQNKAYGINRTVESTDHFLFHSPYNKLVQKSFARLLFQDMKMGEMPLAEGMDKFVNMQAEKTYEDKDLETKLKDISVAPYKEKVAPGCTISQLVGNTYTASVYLNLANLISFYGESLDQKSVVLFSYGSGALASMFQLNPRKMEAGSRFSLLLMQQQLNIASRLADREELQPNALTEALQARESSHGVIPFKPTYLLDRVFPGTYYIDNINTSYERVYVRKPLSAPRVIGGPLFPLPAAPAVKEDDGFLVESPVDISSSPNGHATNAKHIQINTSDDNGVGLGIRRNTTYVWPSGRPNVRVVITGVAAATPGLTGSTFTPGVHNIHRILQGESCISPVPDTVKDNMLEKNVVELIKSKDGMTKKTLRTYEESINLRASLGQVDLTHYGVSESIVNTMDRAVQVAVAAGLEALKDAGIVHGDGEGTSGWILPPSMQETTGVVYATSFPALDAAIGEVSKYFATKTVDNQRIANVIESLRNRLEKAVGKLSSDTEAALNSLRSLADEVSASADSNVKEYEFDRKFLFKMLVLGNAQLAQIIKARGPNMQTNAACAGSTQAVAIAYDLIQSGRAERMIVIAGDNASSDTLMPWLGNGFRALGAATKCAQVELAALPFDARRSGMILGAGGIGMILESEEGANRRYSMSPRTSLRPAAYRCRLIGTLFSNSAYHGASLDRQHIAHEFERFIASVEKEQGISRVDIARHGVYFSHETSTHASDVSSCASNEVGRPIRAVISYRDLFVLGLRIATSIWRGCETLIALEYQRFHRSSDGCLIRRCRCRRSPRLRDRATNRK